MGHKISIDSATMANKGLEIIEASRLFGMPHQQIKVLIHPQSHVHAMIRTIDGAYYAQISTPDMRLPIHAALHWPHTLPAAFVSTELAGKDLQFLNQNKRVIPCFG